MEESLSGSHFECSKTSPSSQQHDDQDGISESGENDEESTKPAHNQNGGSSSNSTIDESEKKTSSSVRPYVRSKMPRLRWTPDLHLRFINAVERLGGQERATPKLVLQHMNIKGLSIAHVKSHLQMYRSKKTDNPGQVLGDHRYLVDCGDRNIYNLSQLPMLQGYNQNHNSSFRYGHDNVSWNGYGNLRHSRSPAFYGTSAEKISGSNTSNWTRNCTTSTFNFPTTNISSFNEHSSSSWKIHKLKSDHEFQPYNTAREFSNPRRFTTTPIINFDPISTHLQANKADHRELITSFNNNVNDRLLDSKAIASSNVQDWKKLKRKASDCNLDLDLSLRITSSRKIIDDQNPKTSREVDGDVDSNLSLSLYSSTCPKLSRLKKLEEAAEDETKKRASTLDLTI